MAQGITTYTKTFNHITEVFITAVPAAFSTEDSAALARNLYEHILDVMRSYQARLFQERIFTSTDVNDILAARQTALGSDIDGVLPSVMQCDSGATPGLRGIQIHAIAGASVDTAGLSGQPPLGRIVKTDDCHYLGLSAVMPLDLTAGPYDQGASIFDQAQAILSQYGSDFYNVPRTWLWLRNVLDWYDDLNRARNTFFTQAGLLGGTESSPMPASTGIGLGPGNSNALCSMDLTATLNGQTITYAQAGGKQKSAYEYGSAFSRASQILTPAGVTTFISGTASIDKAGRTTNIGHAEAQIRDTITNVIAVLGDMGCGEADVVQVMAYCKTPDVLNVFNAMLGKPDWPWITMICDVCRDDLLFEIEALAIQSR